MISKIFQILEGIKKTSKIEKSSATNTIEKIVTEVNESNINPVEAYIMLDYLSKVTSEAMKLIKPTTLDYIGQNGDNRAFGVELQLIERKDYQYEQDKDWVEINKKMSIFKDALKIREKFLKDIIDASLKEGKETPIKYNSTITIKPNIS